MNIEGFFDVVEGFLRDFSDFPETLDGFARIS